MLLCDKKFFIRWHSTHKAVSIALGHVQDLYYNAPLYLEEHLSIICTLIKEAEMMLDNLDKYELEKKENNVSEKYLEGEQND